MPSDVETKFINSLFLKNLIENHYGYTNVVIKKFSVEPATRDKLGKIRSSLNQILVKYSSQESPDNSLSIVAKIKPTTGDLTDEYKKGDVFDKEIEIYTKTLPEMTKILNTAGAKISIGPELVYSAEVPTDVLIFEDLTSSGYCVEDATKGLSLSQSLLTVEKLAFFHAASVIMLEKNNNKFASFGKGTFHNTNRLNLKYFTESFRNFIESANDFGVEKEILQKLKTLPPRVVEKGIEDYTASINGFQVLNHGDFWTGNVLYLYDKTELLDVVFIDYQNCVVGSPIIDLMYFLTSSVSYDVLASGRDEIIYTYHDTLTTLLNKLKYRGYVPTLHELQLELLKRGALECIFTLTTAPYLRTQNSQIAPEIQPALYKNASTNDKTVLKTILEQHKSGLNAQLNRFDNLGLLDWGIQPSKVRGLMGSFQVKA